MKNRIRTQKSDKEGEERVQGVGIDDKPEELNARITMQGKTFPFLISLFKTYEISVSFTRSEKKAMDNIVYIINKIKFEIK